MRFSRIESMGMSCRPPIRAGVPRIEERAVTVAAEVVLIGPGAIQVVIDGEVEPAGGAVLVRDESHRPVFGCRLVDDIRRPAAPVGIGAGVPGAAVTLARGVEPEA